MHTLVEITDVDAGYGARAVLRSVSFSVDRGEIVGLIGINGAGKSTLVDVLTGRHEPSSGGMVLAGERYAPESLEEAQACGVGVVSQNSEPPTGMTVGLALFRNTYRAAESHESIRERAVELLADAAVELSPDTPIATLDRGRRALVEIVRMLAEEAQLVVIDEIAVTLADHEIAVLHAVLRRLAAQGRGILYITHRMDEIRSVVDRLLVLRHGEIAVDRPAGGLAAAELTALLVDDAAWEAPHYRVDDEKDRSDRSDAPTEHDDGSASSVVLAATDLFDGGTMRRLDLRLHSGEIVGLTGTFDSGVRELVEVLGGARRPVHGAVEVHGHPVVFESVADAERHGIGFLPDSAGSGTGERRLIDDAAGDDVDVVREIRRARRMIELVDELRINTTDITASVDRLSGGDQQKAEFVRTVERDNDALVLLHPSRGVDVVARRALFGFLRRLADRGVAIAFVSSDMSELLEWSDRIVVVAEGVVALETRPADTDEDSLMRAMLGGRAVEGGGRRERRD